MNTTPTYLMQAGPADTRADDLAEPAVRTMRLLHVEDNPADALLMQEYIKGILPKVEFDTAERLADLTAERARAADCAILDLSLPDATGLEALMALRSMSGDLPIIVLTGFEDLEVGLSALRYGADDYLVKNHVDGFTLERAVRYAIERRALAVDAEREAVAAMVATAGEVIAKAALDAERLPAGQQTVDRGIFVTPNVAVGTHQVAVRIDRGSGDYALVCESCAWEADRGRLELHSWRDRSLEWVLMRHVAFGNIPDAATALPAPDARAGSGHHVAADETDDPDADPVSRRTMLSPGSWLQPQTDGD